MEDQTCLGFIGETRQLDGDKEVGQAFKIHWSRSKRRHRLFQSVFHDHGGGYKIFRALFDLALVTNLLKMAQAAFRRGNPIRVHNPGEYGDARQRILGYGTKARMESVTTKFEDRAFVRLEPAEKGYLLQAFECEDCLTFTLAE